MSIFKAYDIRGIYPDQFDEELAFSIGLAIAHLFEPPIVVIGRDARTSSETIMSAIVDALVKSGCSVIDIGLASTPMVYHFAGSRKIPLGLIVTASHNSSDYNGLKICQNGARPVSTEQIASIEQWVERFGHNGSSGAVFQGSPCQVETVDPFPDYQRYIHGFADFRPGFRIAVDTGNAICGMVIPQVFSGLDLEIIPLYFELDGQFPNHDPDPLRKENTLDLQRKVLEHSCHFGVALDGDGDRVMFIDEQGRYVPADIAGLLMALDVIQREPPPRKIVIDTRTSKSVVEVLGRQGVEVIRGRVGHTMVKAKIHEVGAVFGAELSGHYYFRESFFAENSDLAIISMLNILTRLERPLSALVDENNKYFHSGEINFRVGDKKRVVDTICDHYSDAEISFVDGVTGEYPSWWFNLRPSNTEDVLRLNLEADSQSELENRTNEVVTLIKKISTP